MCDHNIKMSNSSEFTMKNESQGLSLSKPDVYTSSQLNAALYQHKVQENSWIDQYLNPEVLASPIQIQDGVSQLQLERYSTQKEIILQTNQYDHPIVQKKNRSLFHNFQKHIISLLKRIISIRRVDVLNVNCGLQAYQLWKIFKNSKDFTKKILYLIFGVMQEKQGSILRKMAKDIPQLQRLLSKSSQEILQGAQALLRERVFSQLSSLSKSIIKLQCKMQKFEEFYSYLTNFIRELESDGLSKRLKKGEKIRILEDQSHISAFSQ